MQNIFIELQIIRAIFKLSNILATVESPRLSVFPSSEALRKATRKFEL
jgi:predicted RNA-binding protein with PUA-like domain